MNRLSVAIDDITLVLRAYTQIKVYRAASSGGVYSEITDGSTRIVIIPENTVYSYIDDTGTATHWYKTSYYNPSPEAESALSSARQSGSEVQKLGYTFRNYAPPTGEWGKVLTADDMRYTYLFGIDAVASDTAESTWMDEQFDSAVDFAVAEFERYLTIDIYKRVYKTNPADTLIQSKYWREGVDYTDEEDPYEFIPEEWRNFGFLQLRHYPIISIERGIMYSQVKTQVIDLLGANWVRLDKPIGQIAMFPKGGYAYGPFAVGMMPWRMLGTRYPEGFEFDYTTGYKTADRVPDDLRVVIGKLAAIDVLSKIGDGILYGVGSMSVSLDGLSESYGSTLSGDAGLFAPRIKKYTEDIQLWLTRNRYKFGPVPMSFVGV